MAQVTVVFSFSPTKSVTTTAGIDGKSLTFDASRTVTITEPPGTHTLQWSIHAPPGTKYKIAITAPPEASFFDYEDVLGNDGVDSGFQKFPVHS